MSYFGKAAMNGTSTNMPCPDCGGQGQKVTFSIPKEDWESGLTGYALYSCNTRNGIVACANCGGHGAKYEAWYLLEQPKLATSAADYKRGSGRVPFQRMPSKVSWWLDSSALPEHEVWARLTVEDSGKAAVLDCDGKIHEFPSAAYARDWLLEDEYSMLENIEAAEFMHGRKPQPPALTTAMGRQLPSR